MKMNQIPIPWTCLVFIRSMNLTIICNCFLTVMQWMNECTSPAINPFLYEAANSNSNSNNYNVVGISPLIISDFTFIYFSFSFSSATHLNNWLHPTRLLWNLTITINRSGFSSLYTHSSVVFYVVNRIDISWHMVPETV